MEVQPGCAPVTTRTLLAAVSLSASTTVWPRSNLVLEYAKAGF